MKTIKISEGYVEILWGTLGEGPETSEFSELNLNNKASIDLLVNKILLPFIKSLTLSDQFRIQNSLKYAINFWDEQRLRRCYERALPQLYLPTYFSVKDFYIKIWSRLYNDEDYEISDTFLYEEISRLDIYKKCYSSNR